MRCFHSPPPALFRKTETPLRPCFRFLCRGGVSAMAIHCGVSRNTRVGPAWTWLSAVDFLCRLTLGFFRPKATICPFSLMEKAPISTVSREGWLPIHSGQSIQSGWSRETRGFQDHSPLHPLPALRCSCQRLHYKCRQESNQRLHSGSAGPDEGTNASAALGSPDDHSTVINMVGAAAGIARKKAQVLHRAVFPEKRVWARASIRDADDHALVIDAMRFTGWPPSVPRS